MIGIICATDEELAAVLRSDGLGDATVKSVAGLSVFRMTWRDGSPVVVAKTGMGKVNAAMATTVLCDRYHCSAIVFVGVAGCLDPAIRAGDTVWLTHVACHDYGMRTADGFFPVKPGLLPMDGARAASEAVPNPLGCDPAELRAGPDDRLVLGVGVTGDAFIQSAEAADQLRRDFGAVVVDMESYAVFQVCRSFGVSLVILRSVTDDAGEESSQDYMRNAEWCAEQAAAYIHRIVDRLHGLGAGAA